MKDVKSTSLYNAFSFATKLRFLVNPIKNDLFNLLFSKIGSYSCVCPSGFTGKSCDINIDDCVNVTCQNGGRCQDLLNDFNCKCPVTHIGQYCQKGTDKPFIH